MVYRVLSALNRVLLPRLSKRADLSKLSPVDKAIVGWRMWVTYRRLDADNRVRDGVGGGGGECGEVPVF